jgi:leucyl aminopeptidase (aminopeptidase T)
LTHTNAVKEAAKKGVRIATLPAVTKEILERTIDIDYNKVEERLVKIKSFLEKGKNVRITTEAGTNLTFSIENRKIGTCAGIITRKGKVDNIPAGEVFVAPVEGTANGKLIIDGSVLNIKIKNNIEVIVKEGYAITINGKEEAAELKKTLSSINDKNAFNIAEFGIGINDKAIVTGNVLEDEKVLGTIHIAFGKNSSFGGKIDVPVHIDGIVLKPTVYVDNKLMIEKGKLLL